MTMATLTTFANNTVTVNESLNWSESSSVEVLN